MARVYTWIRTKRIALAFCALALLGAAGVWALQERQQPAGGPSALPAAGAAAANGNPFSWPYEITEHSSMPRDLSFAEAKADFEQMVGEEVDMVGTAGAWAEISTPGTLLDVPLDVFEGPPPDEITVEYDFAISFGGYATVFERVSGVTYELVFVGEFSAAYAPPPWPEIVQWGDELAPHPDLSAALAQAFTDMGEQGSIYVMPSVMLRVEDPYVSTWQPTPIDTWRAGGNFLYEFKAPPNQPPVAAVSADPTVGDAPLTVAFDGRGSSDPDGTIVNYAWTFGDGATASGTQAQVSHTYNNPNNYTATLKVTDDKGATDSASVTITVNQPNQPPVAAVSADPTFGKAPLEVSFDGRGSSDPDGTIVNYAWTFGDGATASGTQAQVRHTYNAPDTYTATLTVTDDKGAKDTASLTIEVIAVDRLVVKPTAVTLLSGEKKQFKAEGTWYGPDGKPDTADDETYDVTSLVSWRVEPREVGALAPGTITAAGLFTAGTPPGDDERRLRGFVFATLTFDTETKEAWAEVDVWEPKLGLEWTEPEQSSRPEKWVHVGDEAHFEGKVTYVAKDEDNKNKEFTWDFTKHGKLDYEWTVTYLPTGESTTTEQVDQDKPPEVELIFPEPGKYSIALRARTRAGKILVATARPAASGHAVRLTPHYGVPGATKVPVTLEGTKFPPKSADVDFGAGITVDKITNKNTTAEITIARGATLGPRNVQIGKGKKRVTLTNAFWVVKIDIMVNAQDAVQTDDIVCGRSTTDHENPPVVPVHVKLAPAGAATAARPITLYLEDVLNPAKAKGGISGDVQFRTEIGTPIDHVTFPDDADAGGVVKRAVTGPTKSNRQDDVLLQARAESAAGPIYAKQDMTVLWVEMVGRNSLQVIWNSPVYEDWNATFAKTLTLWLGVQMRPGGIRRVAEGVVEIRGRIFPKDFNVGRIPAAPLREKITPSPVGNAQVSVSVGLGFVMNRIVTGRRLYLDGVVQRRWSIGPGAAFEDDSRFKYQDVTPNPDPADPDAKDGNKPHLVIVDMDGPTGHALSRLDNPTKRDSRTRINFVHWTTFTYTIGGQRLVVRCSDDYKWAVRTRIKRIPPRQAQLWLGPGDMHNDGKGENEVFLGKHNPNLNP